MTNLQKASIVMRVRKVIAIYARVSTEAQASEGFSIPAQLDNCRRAALLRYGDDIDIIEYVDEGISAKTIDARPDLRKLIHDVNEGRIDAVVTWKISRLSRTLRDAITLAEFFKKHKANFISASEGFDLDTPMGRLLFTILATLAEHERLQLSENVTLGMNRRAQEGEWNGGKVLGYTSNIYGRLEVVDDEAQIVRLIYDKYLEGFGLKKIAVYLNSRGYLTKKSNQFDIGGISRILKNPLYKGWVRFGYHRNWFEDRRKGKSDSPITTKGQHQAIIDEESWDKVQQILKARNNGLSRRYSGRYPLTGLIKCPSCGTGMIAVPGAKLKNGEKQRYYGCQLFKNKHQCNSNLIRSDKVEDQVWARFDAIISKPGVIQAVTEQINSQIAEQAQEHTQDNSRLRRQLSELTAAKKRLISGLTQGVLSLEDISSEMKSLKEMIRELESQLEETKKPRVPMQFVSPNQVGQYLKHFESLVKQLTGDELKDLLHSAIEAIVLNESRNLDYVRFRFDIENICGSPEDDHDPTPRRSRRRRSQEQSTQPELQDPVVHMTKPLHLPAMKVSVPSIPLFMVRFSLRHSVAKQSQQKGHPQRTKTRCP